MIIDISHRYYCLPPDARPVGRERHVYVEPDGNGAWMVSIQDEGGGAILADGISKAEAIRIGTVKVLRLNATMSVSNGEDRTGGAS